MTKVTADLAHQLSLKVNNRSTDWNALRDWIDTETGAIWMKGR